MPVDKGSEAITNDYITGRAVPDVGAERNRQLAEQVLVEHKGYAREDIDVDRTLRCDISGETYTSKVDLVVRVKGRPFMAIKCAPGSLDSRQREILSAARLLEDYQIPIAAATDGKDVIVWETISGRCIGQGMAALPSREAAEASFDPDQCPSLTPSQRQKAQLVFRSYDSMNVNRV